MKVDKKGYDLVAPMESKTVEKMENYTAVLMGSAMGVMWAGKSDYEKAAMMAGVKEKLLVD